MFPLSISTNLNRKTCPSQGKYQACLNLFKTKKNTFFVDTYFDEYPLSQQKSVPTDRQTLLMHRYTKLQGLHRSVDTPLYVLVLGPIPGHSFGSSCRFPHTTCESFFETSHIVFLLEGTVITSESEISFCAGTQFLALFDECILRPKQKHVVLTLKCMRKG